MQAVPPFGSSSATGQGSALTALPAALPPTGGFASGTSNVTPMPTGISGFPSSTSAYVTATLPVFRPTPSRNNMGQMNAPVNSTSLSADRRGRHFLVNNVISDSDPQRIVQFFHVCEKNQLTGTQD